MQRQKSLLGSLLFVTILGAACAQRVQWLNATTVINDFPFTNYISPTPRIFGVSNSGIVFGFVYQNNIFYAYRYRLFSDQKMEFINSDSTKPISLVPTSMSDDGAVIVGVAEDTNGTHLFKWSQSSGIEYIQLPQHYFCGTMTSPPLVSGDGSVILASPNTHVCAWQDGGIMIDYDALDLQLQLKQVSSACLLTGGKVYELGTLMARKCLEELAPETGYLYKGDRFAYFTTDYSYSPYEKYKSKAYKSVYIIYVETIGEAISPCGGFIAIRTKASRIIREPQFVDVYEYEHTDYGKFPKKFLYKEFSCYKTAEENIIREYVSLIKLENNMVSEIARFSAKNRIRISRGARLVLVDNSVYTVLGDKVVPLNIENQFFTPLGVMEDIHELYGLYQYPGEGARYVRMDISGKIKPIGIPMTLLPETSEGLQSIKFVSRNGRYIIANVHTGYEQDYEPFQVNPSDIPVPVPVTVPTYSLAAFDTAPSEPTKQPQKPQPKKANSSNRPAASPKKAAPTRRSQQKKSSPPPSQRGSASSKRATPTNRR